MESYDKTLEDEINEKYERRGTNDYKEQDLWMIANDLISGLAYMHNSGVPHK